MRCGMSSHAIPSMSIRAIEEQMAAHPLLYQSDEKSAPKLYI
jgi:hypothetical protein